MNNDVTNKYIKQFKKNVEFLIKRTGKKKKDIETELGLGQGYFSKYLNKGNEQFPNFHIMFKIAEMGKVSLDKLVKQDLEEEFKNNFEKKDDTFKLVLERMIEEMGEARLEYEEIDFNLQDYTYNIYQPYINEFILNHGSEIINFSRAFCCKLLNMNAFIIIVKFPCSEVTNEMEYEAYTMDNNKINKIVHKSHFNGIRDEFYFDILEKFWDKVEDYSELGKEKAELKNLYNKYLNEFEMPF